MYGPEFWKDGVSISQLPNVAIARGARPHWLGHIAVANVEGVTARITAQGGQRLGSTGAVRDPFGALLLLTSRFPTRREPSVVWHIHHSDDRERSLAFYAETLGWDETGGTTSRMTYAVRLPNVHAQWLHCFPVPDLEASRTRAVALGGLALDASRMPSGDLVAACDDPQGAAFALHQSARQGSQQR